MCLKVFKTSSKLYVNVKLESSLKQEALWLSAWLDRLKLRLDRLKLGQIAFLQNSNSALFVLKHFLGFLFILSIKGKP